ncbi:MAG: ATPase, partial [Roseburia sp.]|nr:ATPase [Roseburia sp.]
MKLLHITGPKADIDRVMDTYLSNYEIHFENAIASLNNLANVRPFVESNLYKDEYAKAKLIWEQFGREDMFPTEKMKVEEAAQVIDSIYALAEEIVTRQEQLKQERLAAAKLMEEIEPFRELDYEFKKILEFKFIAYRFGRISRDYYQKLERYIHDTDHMLFYECHSDEDYVWGAYFVPKMYVAEVDAVCLSFHYERIYVPDTIEGTPDAAYLELEQQIKDYEKEELSLKNKMRELLEKHERQFTCAYYSLETYCRNFDIRKMAVCTKPKFDGSGMSEYYILYGWMSRRDAAGLERDIQGDDKVHIMEEDVDETSISGPPTKLRNPKIFKPFEMFVQMYGLPAYNEMDPTIFIALTYTLMFGIMFGDVGQGLCLVAGGFALYKLKKMNLAAIISVAGIWSTVFGFLYGS